MKHWEIQHMYQVTDCTADPGWSAYWLPSYKEEIQDLAPTTPCACFPNQDLPVSGKFLVPESFMSKLMFMLRMKQFETDVK